MKAKETRRLIQLLTAAHQALSPGYHGTMCFTLLKRINELSLCGAKGLPERRRKDATKS